MRTESCTTSRVLVDDVDDLIKSVCDDISNNTYSGAGKDKVVLQLYVLSEISFTGSCFSHSFACSFICHQENDDANLTPALQKL